MLGFMFNEQECKELSFMLRKELDEMLFDMSDQRLDLEVKQAISNRYRTVFRMYARIATPKDLSRYVRNHRIMPMP
ncbi:hypothetical protein [Paenibacillus marinisediminis]